MSLPEPQIYNPATDHELLTAFVGIHAACITQDHTMATFLPPLSDEKMLKSWTQWSDQVRQGSRAIIYQMAPAAGGEGDEVAGVVSLSMPESETGPFRSEVGRLLVSPGHRKQGVARRMMAKLEEVAKENRRWMIVLDTTLGSGAEFVYPRLGYKEIGIIPKYGFSPKDGSLKDEIFFYKDLRDGQN